MPFCIVDADEREHAHEQDLQAERDDYIAQRCGEIMANFVELAEYLPDWHEGSIQLVMNIDRGLLDDEDYHWIHEDAVEEITDIVEREVK